MGSRLHYQSGCLAALQQPQQSSAPADLIPYLNMKNRPCDWEQETPRAACAHGHGAGTHTVRRLDKVVVCGASRRRAVKGHGSVKEFSVYSKQLLKFIEGTVSEARLQSPQMSASELSSRFVCRLTIAASTGCWTLRWQKLRVNRQPHACSSC